MTSKEPYWYLSFVPLNCHGTRFGTPSPIACGTKSGGLPNSEERTRTKAAPVGVTSSPTALHFITSPIFTAEREDRRGYARPSLGHVTSKLPPETWGVKKTRWSDRVSLVASHAAHRRTIPTSWARDKWEVQPVIGVSLARGQEGCHAQSKLCPGKQRGVAVRFFGGMTYLL